MIPAHPRVDRLAAASVVESDGETGDRASVSQGSSPRTARVAIVDDCELVRHAVRDVLHRAGGFEVVAEADDGAEALAAIAATAPDLVVLDVGLADESGTELCRAVGRDHPEAVCVVLTAFDDEDAHLDAIRAGAAGVLVKTVPPDELVASLRRAVAGESLIDADFIMRAVERTRAVGPDPPELAGLSEQQRRVVELVGQGLTNRQIGERLHLSEKTIKNYVSVILSALDMHRRTEVAALVARVDERRQREAGAVRGT
jgi:DNA-binding NarL/FixJ family response regulator